MTTDKKTTPKEAPAKASTSITAPMAAWVKNGSTSGKHDAWMAAKQHDAKVRRAAEDKKFQIAKNSPKEANIRQQKLGGTREHPVAVLGLRHPKDHSIMDWMVCEITDQTPEGAKEPDLLLMMQCVRCIRTYHRPPDETIMHIRQSHRKWTLDQRTKAERKVNPLLKTCAGEIWVNPEEKAEVHIIAGMVNTDDWCKCPICSWTFKIDDSVIYTK